MGGLSHLLARREGALVEVTINLGGLVETIVLGRTHIGDDDVTVIGHSRVAYLARKDPGHIFLHAAAFHDSCYEAGSPAQQQWPRSRVDSMFLCAMLVYAAGNYELEREAVTLYLIVRMYGSRFWDNPETRDY